MSKPKILKTPTLHYVEEVAGATSPGVTEIALEEIDLGNTQFEYRLDPGLELLIDSIKKDGQQIPVIVRGIAPPYQLICGFRRTRSIAAIGGAGRPSRPSSCRRLPTRKPTGFQSLRTRNARA